jgi:hypothetical protein
MKRTPLRRRSARKRREDANCSLVRNEFRYEHARDLCWWDRRRLGTEIHEILCGPLRRKAVSEPCCWLWLCRDCHREIQGWPAERKVDQLAVKMVRDFGNYNLTRVCLIRNPNAPNWITQAEVWAAVKRLGL